MASITNASKAYVSTGNGNAYSLIKNNYITCSVYSGNITLIWNDNNDGTATITGTVVNSNGASTIFMMPPGNVSNFSIQSCYVNDQSVNGLNSYYQYIDGPNEIQKVQIGTYYQFIPAGNVVNLTINVSNVTYKTLNF